ncbi:chemotaxis protein [Bartonella sp. DGB2]|uniref:chemotaxis protein n=1 Tax=Bartonella sp. DGB2 TaxID=3388426 RepID=UPI003990037D
MTIWRAFALWIVRLASSLVILCAGLLPLYAEGLQPMRLVRSLQALQDNVAAGQSGAAQSLVRFLTKAGDDFAQVPLEEWEKESNLYALLVYLFNGGNPKVVEPILRRSAGGIIDQNLLEGAMAYIRHDRRAFAQAFKTFPGEETAPIDKKWPIALSLSILLNVAEDSRSTGSEEEVAQLDRIRLLAPGTLYEEAAIRRELAPVIQTGDTPLLLLLTRNYAERFSRSPYAIAFWQQFAFEVPKLDEKLTDDQLLLLVSYAPLQAQFVTYTRISRSALIAARMERAQFSASQAMALASQLQIDDTTLKFYYAASLVGSLRVEEGDAMLKRIPVSALSLRDQPLFDAAGNVAKIVLADLSLPKKFKVEEVMPLGSKAALSSDLVSLPLASGVETIEDAIYAYRENDKATLPAQAIEEKVNQRLQNTAQFIACTEKKIEQVDQLLKEQARGKY